MHGNRLHSQYSWLAASLLAGLFFVVSFAWADDDKPQEVAKPAAAEDKAEATKTEAKKDEVAKDEKKKDAPANPLSNLIRGIFGGAKPKPKPPEADLIPTETPDGKPIPGNGDVTARDHIDTRAPFDTQQASRLRKATALMAAGQHQEAALWLQKILDTVFDEEDSVIRMPDGELRSVGSEANRLLGQFPPDAIDAYRREHGALAQNELQEAVAKGDIAGIAEIADKYFHTEAGQEAANTLGSEHFDRGEFGPAARRFQQLLQADARVTYVPQWGVKAAIAFRESGMSDELKQLRTRLSQSAVADMQVGGRTIDPEDWLNQLGQIAGTSPPRLDEWRMVYGSPQRTGTAIGGDPLLLERWHAPLTNNREVAEQVQILMEDLADQNRAAIPAWHAITVGNKVVFRTLRGVQVVDADSGQPLWETRAGVSPEQLLTGQSSQPFDYQQVQMMGVFRVNNGMLQNYRNNSADQHPLASLLFRNGTYGVISSHRDKLFVVEDHAVLSQQQPGYYWGARQNQNDPYRRDWSTNKLAAYNLEDGHPVWEIGGRDTREAIQLPLAGTYFFGTPTPSGKELFIVGERDNEIRLYSLDPETGRPNWSQLLAVSEAKIDEDFGRRWWNAQVAVGGGVIVCPTTVGWLVAVDRTSRAIQWAYRYSPPIKGNQNNFGGRQVAVVQNSSFGQRWAPSAPIISGGRVVYTPPEYTVPNSSQAGIVCLNLSDGKKVWQKDKGNHAYLAGVFSERALLVGATAVSALSLEDGSTLWNRPVPTSDGPPSGFGVAVGDRFHLPLSSGQLWTIDLEKGNVLSKAYLSDRFERLGNLVMHRGMLLSLSPVGLTSFEQREAIVAEIKRRKMNDPHDAWALLREADIHVVNREFEPALALMREIQQNEIDANLRPHYREQMIACLTEVIRSDFANRTAELDLLATLAEKPEEKLHARRLEAEQLESSRQYLAAFAIYRSLATEDAAAMVERSTNTKVSLPLDRWLAGRMGDLWQQMDEATRGEAGKGIAALAEASADDPAALERFIELYGFHPETPGIRQRLAKLYADRGEVTLAQNHLMRLTRSSDEKTAARALYHMAQLMDDQKLASDAYFYYQQLAGRHPEVEVAEGMTSIALFEKRYGDGPSPEEQKLSRLDWGKYDLKIERTGASYNSSRSYELKSGAFRLPYFRQFRFEIDSQQKLAVIRLEDGRMHWLVPLRGKAQSSQNYPVAEAVGHRLFVLYRDVLHCLSPFERKVLWTRTLETRGNSSGYYYSPNQQNLRPMQSGQSILSGQALVQRNTETGMLAVANSNYVCIYGRREFTVLDAATGEVRWTRDQVPAYTKLVGNEDVLYMVPQNRNDAVAFRASDGKPLEVANVGGLMAQAIRISERGLVLMEARSSSSILGLSSSSTTVLRQFNPLTDQTHWRHSFPDGAYFTLLEDDTLAALRKDGTFATVDLESGRLTELGRLEEKELSSRSQMYVIADRDNVYLLVNQSRRSGSYYSLGIPFLRMHGTVFAFSRESGKRLWAETVNNQNLVTSQFEHSPVMTFAMRTYVRKGQLNYWTLNMLVLDKTTGRKVIESTSPFNNSFRSFDVNLADKFIELRSYNDRIRLVAVNRDSNPVKAPTPGK